MIQPQKYNFILKHFTSWIHPVEQIHFHLVYPDQPSKMYLQKRMLHDIKSLHIDIRCGWNIKVFNFEKKKG